MTNIAKLDRLPTPNDVSRVVVLGYVNGSDVKRSTLIKFHDELNIDPVRLVESGNLESVESFIMETLKCSLLSAEVITHNRITLRVCETLDEYNEALAGF